MVTGANSGIGYETAVELAAHGAHVLLACREPARGQRAADRVVGAAPGASAESLTLDLAELDSVRRAAGRIASEHGRLDLLVNNAGVMAVPFQVTPDGFERQVATNHLGHFALTGLLLDLLLTTQGSRVVTVSSLAHRAGRLVLPARPANPAGYNRWFGLRQLEARQPAFHLRARLAGYARPGPAPWPWPPTRGGRAAGW